MKIDLDFFFLDQIDDYVMLIDENFDIFFKNSKIITASGDIFDKKKCYQTIYDFSSNCSKHGLECPIEIIKKNSLTKYHTVHKVKDENNIERKFLVATYKLSKEDLFLEMFINLDDMKIVNKVSKETIEGLIDKIPKPVAVETPDFIVFNKKFKDLFQLNKDSYSSFFTALKPVFDSQVLYDFIYSLKSCNEPKFDLELKDNKGQLFSFSFVPLKIDNIFKDFYLWIIETIHQDEDLFRTLAETSAAGIFLHQGKFIYVNPALCEITEYKREELINMNPLNLVHPDFKNKVKELMLRRLKGDKTKHVYEVKIITKSGQEKWVQVASSAVFYKDAFAGIGTVIDITDRKEYEEKLKKLATYDSLTNLYNRYMIEEFLEKEIEKSKRHNVPLSIIMCDIDDFKKINDTYGHIFGDKVLKKISSVLKANIRKSDAIGRWGGEEFIIIAPYTNVYGAQKLAEKIRNLVENTKIDDVYITISCGVAEYKYSETKKEFFKRVDEALYLAKKKGKNTVEVAL